MNRAQEIIKIIKDNDLLQQFFNSDYWEYKDGDLEDFYPEGSDRGWKDLDKAVENYLESLGLPTEYSEVDGRCDTSEFWSVVHFPTEDIYLKIEGEYDSYGQGEHEYDSITQVFPKEVTTIIYE